MAFSAASLLGTAVKYSGQRIGKLQEFYVEVQPDSLCLEMFKLRIEALTGEIDFFVPNNQIECSSVDGSMNLLVPPPEPMEFAALSPSELKLLHSNLQTKGQNKGHRVMISSERLYIYDIWNLRDHIGWVSDITFCEDSWDIDSIVFHCGNPIFGRQFLIPQSMVEEIDDIHCRFYITDSISNINFEEFTHNTVENAHFGNAMGLLRSSNY